MIVKMKTFELHKNETKELIDLIEEIKELATEYECYTEQLLKVGDKTKDLGCAMKWRALGITVEDNKVSLLYYATLFEMVFKSKFFVTITIDIDEEEDERKMLVEFSNDI